MDRLSLTMELKCSNRTEMQQRLIITPKIKLVDSEREKEDFKKRFITHMAKTKSI